MSLKIKLTKQENGKFDLSKVRKYFDDIESNDIIYIIEKKHQEKFAKTFDESIDYIYSTCSTDDCSYMMVYIFDDFISYSISTVDDFFIVRTVKRV